ncbi:MAG: SDR family oxidoreductase [Bryobacteraceae bacterium]
MALSGTKGRKPGLSLLTKAALSAGALYGAGKLLAISARRQKIELRNQVVLITGGSRGLGFALAQELGARGCRLALCARNADELQKACESLAQRGIEAAPFACDISDESEIPALVKRVWEHFGTIDILINNAGHISVGPMDTFDRSDYERAMNVMFWAPLNLTFAALPYLKRARRGHIVNITSVGGRVSIPHLLPYSCAKFALVGFSTGIGSELSLEGIHVLTVVPGLMRTGSYLNAEFKGKARQEFAWFGVLGNFPGFTVAAEYAARCICKALENGRSTCTISLPAKLLIAWEAVMPETARMMLQFVNRAMLPGSNMQTSSLRGKVLDRQFGKIFKTVTFLGKSSAQRLNE